MQSYDYIVIGSGPAGSVMAKTLSDDRKSSVLLLEAGGNSDADALIREPNSNLYAHMPEYFWFGQSVPQAHVKGRDFPLTGGRVRGGGSSVNGEMYVRPSPFVLRKWEEVGGTQWSPENAAKAFTALERFHGDAANRGKNGRIDIRQNYPKKPAFLKKWTDAWEAATGLAALEDYNNPTTPLGAFGRWQLYQKEDGSRASASVAFLSPDVVDESGQGLEGRRLTALDRATAVKILFDDGKRAIGVRYIRDGESLEAGAAKKVIVCAGLRSAKLLMLSGIGPKDVLEKAGVKLVHDNPNVGRHLVEDACISALISMKADDYAEMIALDPNAKLYGGAFLPPPDGSGEEGERCVQVIVTRASPQALHLSIMCLNTKSRGSLKIQSSDPLKVMLGDFGYLSDDADVKTLMETLRKYIAPMAERLQRADSAYQLISPSAEELADDEKLRAYILQSLMHVYHDQCALRMGSEADGAVNGWGEVYGAKDLIVADASIFPYHVDGNTSAAAYLTGYIIAKHIQHVGQL